MPTLLSTWYGSFLFDGQKLIDKRLVPQEAEAITARLAEMQKGTVLPEERELAEAGAARPTVYEKRLSSVGTLQRQILVPAPPFEAGASGYPDRLLHEALIRLAARETSLRLSDRDQLVVHQVRALDDIVKSANTLAERLREWYAVHAPEIAGRVREHADLARLVAESADRDEAAKRIGEHLAPMGRELPAADEAIVRTFAHGLATLYDTWREIEARLTQVMQEVAPNLTAVTGPMLGARLIAGAGGLERLALASSGTVQTLGAENALFRHLKDGSPPPKHGLLFQHESVNRAPWWHRGKIARALSGKISIAAKADTFGTDPTRGAKLAEDFAARVEEVRRRYPHPPDRRRRFGPPPGRGPRQDRRERR